MIENQIVDGPFVVNIMKAQDLKFTLNLLLVEFT